MRKMTATLWFPSPSFVDTNVIGGSDSGPAQGIITELLTTASPGTWTVPPGVTTLTVECWGAGGGGGGDGGNDVAGGGGGGEYARKTLAVTPGDVIPYVVDSGNGQTSTSWDIGPEVLANSGLNGSTVNVQTGFGGTGGIGSVTFSGGNGAAGDGDRTHGGGGGGSSAGPANNGGSPGTNTGAGAVPGGVPVQGGGGGGSGGANTDLGTAGANPGGGGGGCGGNSSGTGGDGGDGLIKLTYSV
jgi:hypothetical protein